MNFAPEMQESLDANYFRTFMTKLISAKEAEILLLNFKCDEIVQKSEYLQIDVIKW
jgi:hypothetical protein